MKILFLLRHAKSSHDDARYSDFERPLNARGRDAAPAVAAHMRRRGWVPDVVVSSAARRTLETWERMAPTFGDVGPALTDFDLYLAPADTILEKVRALPDDARNALVIGHNPGIEELARALAGDGPEPDLRRSRERFPTAALAAIAFDTDRWADVATGGGHLVAFIRPKDVEAG